VTTLDGLQATKEKFFSLAGIFPDLHLAPWDSLQLRAARSVRSKPSPRQDRSGSGSELTHGFRHRGNE